LTTLAETERKQKNAKISGFQAKRFTQIRKNSIQLSDIELVQTELLDSNRTFPLVIKPNLPEIDLVEWARSNRDFIEEKLLQHAALLFRGFVVNSPKDFEQFAEAACPESVRKLWRSSPGR